MSFIPDVGDMFYFATHRRVYLIWWDADPSDIGIARDTGVFPRTSDGEELANWQNAFLKSTTTFWKWVDDYELHT